MIPYRFDHARTARFKRAVVRSDHGGMLDLLREFGRAGAVISKASGHETPRNAKGFICEARENLLDVTLAWEVLALEGESLDRDDEWEWLGVWVPYDGPGA